MQAIIIEDIPASEPTLLPSPIPENEPAFLDAWKRRVESVFWSGLLWISTPFVTVYRWLLKFGVWFLVRFVIDQRINARAKCPACGVRQEHKFQYSETYQSIIHVCAVCTANWGDKTIVAVKHWHVQRTLESNNDQS